MKNCLIKKIVPFSISLFAFLSTHSFAQVHAKVIGGSAAGVSEFPWIVALHDKVLENASVPSFFCAGTLIDSQWVLTAAHCVSSFVIFPEDSPPLAEPTDSMFISFGSNSILRGRRTREISEIVLNTRGYTFTDDIALVRLAKPIDDIAPLARISAAESDSAIAVGSATVAGWGATNFGIEQLGSGVYPEMLQKAVLNTYTDDQCLASLGTTYQGDRSLCAAVLASDSHGTGAKDACYGDSGGPLVVTVGSERKLLGVVSGGYVCGSDTYPGIFTDVPVYDTWISNTIDPNKRTKTIASVIVDKLPLALARRVNPTDTMTQKEADALAFRKFKQTRAHVIVERYFESLIITLTRDANKLNAKYKAVSLSKLKTRQRKLVRALNLAEENRIHTTVRKAMIAESVRFFKALL